jgi:hypothetical protein
MSRPQRHVTVSGETETGGRLCTSVEQFVDRWAALLYEALDLARRVTR